MAADCGVVIRAINLTDEGIIEIQDLVRDAHWVAASSMRDPVLAVRTASNIEFYSVPSNVIACPTEPTACAQQIGVVPLQVSNTGGNNQLPEISDWTATFTPSISEPTVYVVTGDGNIYYTAMSQTFAAIQVIPSLSYVEIEATRESGTVLAVDRENQELLTLQHGVIIGADTSHAIPYYGGTSAFRIAPSGNYAFMASSYTRIIGNRHSDLETKAIFIGGLPP